MNILLDGRTDIDNNYMEREGIKPYVTGRKNWLFSFTEAGAETSCALYSLVQTARLNHVRVYDYVLHLLDSLPYAEREGFDYSAFLPWSESLPPGMRVRPRETEEPQEGKTNENGAA